MLCKSPITVRSSNHWFPCGQCMPCRLNRRRVWAHRLMLEAGCHSENAFITLTYDDSHLPENGSLEPYAASYVRKWFKNFRDLYRHETGRNLRFYLVGEYGDKSFRPHYHLIVFGYPPCANPYRKKWLRKRKKGCDCVPCARVSRSWARGFTDVAEVTLHSSQYVAGYVTKKMTKKDDTRLAGRYPEHSKMSTKPGIGASALPFIIDSLLDSETGELFLENGDVPATLPINGREFPLGRYLKNKLRLAVGVTDEKAKELFQAWQQELRTMYYDSEEFKASKSFKEFLVAQSATKVAKMERIHKQQQLRKIL